MFNLFIARLLRALNVQMCYKMQKKKKDSAMHFPSIFGYGILSCGTFLEDKYPENYFGDWLILRSSSK